MNYGIIDLGSNTIKLEVFSQNKSIYYNATYAYIVGKVANNILTDEGIDTIIQTLTKYKKVFADLCKSQNQDNKLICFSTASLRYIDNLPQVLKAVKQATNMDIMPLSGDEEAFCNYVSLKHNVGVGDFVGADLGGGSAQILISQNGNVLFSKSFAVGGLKMKRDFIKDVFPTKQEKQEIEKFVHSQCSELIKYKDYQKNLYFMGGSIRLLCALINEQNNITQAQSKQSFSIDELNGILTQFMQNHEQAEQIISNIAPERLTTVIPAMIVINTIADMLGITSIIYTQSSVREGFYLQKEEK